MGGLLWEERLQLPWGRRRLRRILLRQTLTTDAEQRLQMLCRGRGALKLRLRLRLRRRRHELPLGRYIVLCWVLGGDTEQRLQMLRRL
jgi:hypothetical protein